MKKILFTVIMLSVFSLDASGKVPSFSRKVAQFLRQENRIYQDIIQTTFRIDQKKSEVEILEGVVAQYADKKDLEEHEWIQKFNARGQALHLRSQIDRELIDLRWVKMQNLGSAFSQTKAVLQKEIGPLATEAYDQLKVRQYSMFIRNLDSNEKIKAQKDLLQIIAVSKKQLK